MSQKKARSVGDAPAQAKLTTLEADFSGLIPLEKRHVRDPGRFEGPVRYVVLGDMF
jgi:hypothetical protein